MNAITRKLLAYRYIGLALTEDLIRWASDMLLVGYDTESLAILAGLSAPLNWDEVERYFSKSLVELGWSDPGKERCLRQYIRDIALDIIQGALAPHEGLTEIRTIVYAMEEPEYLFDWLHLDDPDIKYPGASIEEVIRIQAQQLLDQQNEGR